MTGLAPKLRWLLGTDIGLRKAGMRLWHMSQELRGGWDDGRVSIAHAMCAFEIYGKNLTSVSGCVV